MVKHRPPRRATTESGRHRTAAIVAVDSTAVVALDSTAVVVTDSTAVVVADCIVIRVALNTPLNGIIV